jgi:O-antigen/teichoic acid export membrane protein
MTHLSLVTSKQKFALQTISVLITRSFMLLSGVLVSIVLARMLGPEGFGIYAAIFAIVNIILSFADLGIRQAVTYTMGQKLYDDQSVISSMLLILILSSCMGIVITLVVFTTGPTINYGWGVIIPAIVSIPLLLTTAYTRGVSLAKGQIGQFNKADLSQRVIFLVALVIFLVALKWGTIGATAAYFLGALAAAIYSIWILSRAAKLRLRYIPPIPRQLISLGFIYALALFILNLNYRVDIVLLERLTNTSQVGLYAAGVRLAELVWQLPAALGVVLFSRSAQSINEDDAVARTTRVLRITLPFIVGGSLVLFVIAPWVLSIFGEAFVDATDATRYLLPGVAAAVIFKVLYSDLAGRGRPLYAVWVFGAVALLNILLNLLLIPTLGINGAAIASSISYIMGAITFAVLYSRLQKLSFRNTMILNNADISYIFDLMKGKKEPDSHSKM